MEVAETATRVVAALPLLEVQRTTTNVVEATTTKVEAAVTTNVEAAVTTNVEAATETNIEAATAILLVFTETRYVLRRLHFCLSSSRALKCRDYPVQEY